MKKKPRQKPPLTVRLTPENELRLDGIMKRSNLDNRNKVINMVIEDYDSYTKHAGLLKAIIMLREEIRK